MKICVLLPGKIKPKVLEAAQNEYARRLKGFGVEITEYRDEKISVRSSKQIQQAEAERIFKWLKPGDFLVACDERGKRIQTMELAELLNEAQLGGFPMAGKRRVVIVVGGALGLDKTVRNQADAVWSLSSLVMAGGVARIVLLEGLYRAFTVLKGHPYHNE